MRQITQEEIEQSAGRISSLNRKETSKLMRTYQKKQEPLLVYLAAIGERDYSNDEQDLLYFLAIVSWDVLFRVFPQMGMVTIPQIEQAEARYLADLEQLVGQPDSSITDYSERQLREHPQPQLLGYILETVMEDDSGRVREESKGLLFGTLLTVVNCLISQIPKSPHIN